MFYFIQQFGHLLFFCSLFSLGILQGSYSYSEEKKQQRSYHITVWENQFSQKRVKKMESLYHTRFYTQFKRSTVTYQKFPPKSPRQDSIDREQRNRKKFHTNKLTKRDRGYPFKNSSRCILFFSCNTCRKSFNTRKQLYRHQEIHLRHRRHLCYDCGKAFRSIKSLFEHKRNIHKRKVYLKKQFKCREPSCNYRYFSKQADLERHVACYH